MNVDGAAQIILYILFEIKATKMFFVTQCGSNKNISNVQMVQTFKGPVYDI